MGQPESFSGVAIFVAAARSRSFTDAGEQLGLTKSAIGKSIAKLEERLGAKLFHRTTRSIALTADGEAYFAACSAALDEITAAKLWARACSGRWAGCVSICRLLMGGVSWSRSS